MRKNRRSDRTDHARAEIPDLICACATVRRASRAVTQLYDNWLRVHGIEGPQFALLALLEGLGESNQATMGRRFDLDKTTLSRNLKLLERRGWIDITAGADARERRVALTAAGRRRLAAARPAWAEAQKKLRSAMSGGEWDAMWAAFRVVTRAARDARRAGGHPVKKIPASRDTPAH